MTIAWRVEEIARHKGFSAKELAERSGLTEKTVRNILAGKATRVDLRTIDRLSATLGVTPGALWKVASLESWKTTRGIAGAMGSDELAELMSGSEPALERAKTGS
ncbi:MAG: helix-turn-helix domain-containing protein [Actinomycetota bacterium]